MKSGARLLSGLGLSFARTGELRGAYWNEFALDADEPIWRIPANRMKMSEDHLVPLATQTVNTLRELKPYSCGSPLLFPSRSNLNRPMSENTLLYALYRMGYHGRATGHGFRATASTTLNEQGWRADVIERQLAHAERNKVRAAYNKAEYLVKAAIGQRDARKALDWADIKRKHQKCLYVIREFGRLEVDFVLCAVHKPNLEEKAVFKRKQRLYNYATRHIIERVSWLVRDRTSGRGFTDLIFENRTNMSYPDLADYLDRLKSQPGSQLVGEVLGAPMARTKDQCKNLQITDAYLGACFCAFEPNRLGMRDTSYLRFIWERLYRRSGNLFSYGLKILPHDQAYRLRVELGWPVDFE
jgi:hypothetical protein